MVRLIAEAHGKKIKLTKVFNPILRIMGLKIGIVNKVFGDLVYDKSMSNYKENYRIRDLKESITATRNYIKKINVKRRIITLTENNTSQ